MAWSHVPLVRSLSLALVVLAFCAPPVFLTSAEGNSYTPGALGSGNAQACLQVFLQRRALAARVRGGAESTDETENAEQRIARMQDEIENLRRENRNLAAATEVRRGTQRTLMDSFFTITQRGVPGAMPVAQPVGLETGMPQNAGLGSLAHGAVDHGGPGDLRALHDGEGGEDDRDGASSDLGQDGAVLDARTIDNVLRAVEGKVPRAPRPTPRAPSPAPRVPSLTSGAPRRPSLRISCQVP